MEPEHSLTDPELLGGHSVQRMGAAGPHSRPAGVSLSPPSQPELSAWLLRGGEKSYLQPNAVKFAASMRTANFSHPDALAGFVKAQDNQIIIITHLRPPVSALCTISVPAGRWAGEAARACLDNLPTAPESEAPSRSRSQQMSRAPNLLIGQPLLQAHCRAGLQRRDWCVYIYVSQRFL